MSTILDSLKPLLESGLVNEETRNAITEAWENKLKEVRSEIRTETREEFAERYEHDKEVMVKTLDKMVSEHLTEEISKIKTERNEVAKLKINTIKETRTAAAKFNKFATRALAEELAEFATERKIQTDHKSKLENFIMSSLAEEINEFAEDKQNVIDTKVKLVTEAKKQFALLKKKFVENSSKAVSNIVAQTLNHELKQLYEDIKLAKQNNFGRKIFEAYATEFTGTFLNENVEVRKLRKKISEISTQLKDKTQLVESTQKNLAKISNRAERNKLLSELLNPLQKSKSEVMSQLLENVQTSQLRVAYDKYLPAVLNNKTQPIVKTGKITLQESTGNKTARIVPIDNESLNDIKFLAGLTTN